MNQTKTTEGKKTKTLNSGFVYFFAGILMFTFTVINHVVDISTITRVTTQAILFFIAAYFVGKRAKQLKRNQMVWALLGFLFAPFMFMVIGFLRGKHLKNGRLDMQ